MNPADNVSVTAAPIALVADFLIDQGYEVSGSNRRLITPETNTFLVYRVAKVPWYCRVFTVLDPAFEMILVLHEIEPTLITLEFQVKGKGAPMVEAKGLALEVVEHLNTKGLNASIKVNFALV